MAESVDIQRKLAAIFAADVEGYSRLMGADEVGTFKRLTERRAILDKAIADHRGRIANTAGDSVLAEFGSAVDAVQCAVEAQAALAEANSRFPIDKRINFRIGIHVGDVMIRAGDLFGDGVNIAARLQTLAQPGGVCVSGAAYDHVRKVLPITFTDLGAQNVKNIEEPITVHAVASVGAAGPAYSLSERGTPLPLPDKPSIAVLAFQNMSGDVEQEYFADGVVEDTTTALSRLKFLFVIARNSSFTYKGKAVDIKQVGRELGVRYVLEGSVRRAANRVRITAQLVEAASGTHLWAERYDRDLADIFAVQEDITASVTTAIAPVLAAAERQHALRKPPDSLDAWEAYHRGMWHFMKQEPHESDNAKPFFRRAIEIDANFAPGYYGLAMTYLWDGSGYRTRDLGECVKIARPLAHRAVALDDADAMAHFALGYTFGCSGDNESARTEMQRALSLDPNHAWAWGYLGGACCFSGRYEEALPALEKAMQVSPHDPLMWAWMLWVTCVDFYKADDEAALRSAERLVRFRPDLPHGYRLRIACLGHLGRANEAREALREAMETFPKGLQFFGTRPPWMRPQDYDRMLEGLRKGGILE